MARIGVIGGGPAGLALAYRMGRLRHQVSLFEAAPLFGGLAGSFRFGDIDVERYYHFICGGDHEYFAWLDELGLRSRLRWTDTRLGFFYNGHLHPFGTPLEVLSCGALTFPGRVRYASFAARCAARTNWQRLDGIPAKDWLIHNLGFDTYHVMWHPLLKLKFHEFHEQISAAWIWHRIHRVATSRGNLLQKERLGYLEGGTQVLIDELVRRARDLGGNLMASRPVDRLLVEDGVCKGIVTADGQEHRFDLVVSTTPLPVFRKIVQGLLPERYARHLASIDFIGVSCVLLRLKHSVSDYYWLNANDPRVPFNGCIEYTKLNPRATPDGTTLLYVPYYVGTQSARFTQSDSETLDDTCHALETLNPSFSRDWVIDAKVHRDRFAQVICGVGFGLGVPEPRTPVKGLYLIESSQLYPADRSISATLELVTKVSKVIGGSSA